MCHQLGIIKYHPSVGADPPTLQSSSPDAHIPVVRVKLTHSVRIPPMKSAVVPVQLVGEKPAHRLALLEPLHGDDLPQVASSFVKTDEQGRCNMTIANPTGFTQKLEKGAVVGEAVDAVCVPADSVANSDQPNSRVGRGEVLEVNGGDGGRAGGVCGGTGGRHGSGVGIGGRVREVMVWVRRMWWLVVVPVGRLRG